MIGGCAALVIAVSAAIVLADANVPVRVDYAASSGCPDALVFGEELRARARVRFVGDKETASTLVVRIKHIGKHYEGRLVVRDVAREETERKVNGDSCAEVVSGLALVSAFALGFTPPSEVADAQAASAPLPDVVDSDAFVSPPAIDATPERAPPVAVEQPRDAAPVESGERAWSVSLGADAQLVSDVSPNLALAVPIWVELARSVGAHFSIASRLRFARASSSSTGSFTWTVGGLDLCPLVWSARPLRADLCARVHAGSLDAFGVGVVPSRDVTRPWVSLGPVASMSLYALGPAFLHLEGALDLPLVRDRFFVEPNDTVFSAPIVGWTAGLGAGATIW